MDKYLIAWFLFLAALMGGLTTNFVSANYATADSVPTKLLASCAAAQHGVSTGAEGQAAVTISFDGKVVTHVGCAAVN